jgi:exodeoxyribonuclease VII large subunit
VGEYAVALRERLRGFTRVQLVGELVNLRPPTRTRVYFELRDAGGSVPCAMWRNDFERLDLAPGTLTDGIAVVVAGGCDYYPGSATSSPSFHFSVSDLRIAGEGDLLARIERLRRRLDAEGLFTTQKRLARPSLPRTIGVITGEGGKARDDVLAGLRRRHWRGRLVWAFAPVQDRHAAPAITRALTDLAAARVDVIVVARGGGSLADLLAFCDETLCRTVAMLSVPVIASVGHHTDRTLLDDVAAVSCSTPTHACESAVPLDCAEERDRLLASAGRLSVHARRSVLERARSLARQARAPSEHLDRERRRLHQGLRELRASARRRVQTSRTLSARHLLVLERRRSATSAAQARLRGTLAERARRLATAHEADRARRHQALEHLGVALAAHDPERTLRRGYALVSDQDGTLVTSAATAGSSPRLRLRFADGQLEATPAPDTMPR